MRRAVLVRVPALLLAAPAYAAPTACAATAGTTGSSADPERI
jgi:hypothetical protein